MTQNQKKVIGYMNDKNIGSFFLDSLKIWVWIKTVRESEDLADRIVKEVYDISIYQPPMKKWEQRLINVSL